MQENGGSVGQHPEVTGVLSRGATSGASVLIKPMFN